MSRSISNEYTQKLKRWVELDNVIEIKKTKLKQYTDEKKKLEDDILDYIEDKDMQNVQINLGDGYIKFAETKGFQGISLKHLKESLGRFFIQHQSDPSKVTPDNVYEYIIGNREVKTKLGMKRHVTS
jgi:hypothetical protein